MEFQARRVNGAGWTLTSGSAAGAKNPREPNRPRDLVLAMIVNRIVAPTSKLATAKALDPATALSSLGVELGLGDVDEDKLYTALDWLHERQSAVETALAKRHLTGGTLVLYDVSSSYVEGRRCPLAKRGYNRDRKNGKAQIVYGLLCAADGCPIAIEVFEGNTGDPNTVADQVAKIKQRFALGHVVLVGDRGMITQARIDEDLRPAGLDWITALRAPALQGLVSGGHLQMSLFDQRDMAAILGEAERRSVSSGPTPRTIALGKTLLAQQLQTSCAKGGEWIGQMAEPVKSLGFYCEDDADAIGDQCGS